MCVQQMITGACIQSRRHLGHFPPECDLFDMLQASEFSLFLRSCTRAHAFCRIHSLVDAVMTCCSSDTSPSNAETAVADPGEGTVNQTFMCRYLALRVEVHVGNELIVSETCCDVLPSSVMVQTFPKTLPSLHSQDYHQLTQKNERQPIIAFSLVIGLATNPA